MAVSGLAMRHWDTSCIIMPAVAPSWLSLQPMQGSGKLSYCSHHSAMLCVYMYVRTYVQLSACHACVCVRHNVAAVPRRVTASCSSRRAACLSLPAECEHSCMRSFGSMLVATATASQRALRFRRTSPLHSMRMGHGAASLASLVEVLARSPWWSSSPWWPRRDWGTESLMSGSIFLSLCLFASSLSLLSVLPLTASQSRGEPFLHPIPKTRSRSARRWPGPLVPAAMEGASPPPPACSVSASLPARIVSRTGTEEGREGSSIMMLSSCVLLLLWFRSRNPPPQAQSVQVDGATTHHHLTHPRPPPCWCRPSIHPDSHPSLPDGAPPWSVLDTDFREPPRTPSSARFVRPPRWREPPGWAGGSVAAAAPGVACLARLPHSFAGSLTVAAMSNGLELGNGCRVGCVKYRGVQGTVRMDKQQTDRQTLDRQTDCNGCLLAFPQRPAQL